MQLQTFELIPLATYSSAAKGLAPWQLRKVLAFIQAHLAEPVRVQMLATLVNLSGGHFSQAFKISTGTSPHNFVIRARVRYAQMLLLTTRAPLAEIALICGFTDQAHMTRCFTRQVDKTPFVWRRLSKAA
jgi:AraC family transcriptional regulator